MTFYLLALSILSVFPYCKISIRKQPLWLWLMLLSVVAGYIEKHINLVGLVSISGYIALFFGTLNITSSIIRMIFITFFVLISLLLALHLVPGFSNLPIVINELITNDAIPYTLYANFDKGMAGVFVCAYCFSKHKTALKTDSKRVINIAFKKSILMIISTVFATLTVALIIGLVRFSPKIPDFWLAFIAINLLFTCVAEEAFFRGLLQTKLSKMIKCKNLTIIAPILATIVFALAHFLGGLDYVLVSAVAGFGYSYIFYKTQRLEWAILSHWSVNMSHFFFFTYPMLGNVASIH
jgi:membrane protease YdiL (CAAX protease family)